jgi:phosphoribosylamine--glycine ligase
MKLLIIDQFDCGFSVDLAIKSANHGHEVRVYMRNNFDGTRCENGDGMDCFKKVADWESSMDWADLIFVTDNSRFIQKLESYRRKGYPIYGCNVEGARWEQDREYGAAIFERAGIPIIPTTKFAKYDEAIAFVLKNSDKRYVSKPIGDGAKDMSYCSKDWRDMVFMLNKWKKSNAYGGEFILQEFHAGSEMAVGGWFGLDGFSKYFLENWEFKKLMSGDYGPATGEQGTVMRYTEKSLLADKVLKPLEGFLHGIGYSGYIDVNCIIDSKGNPWPLEFTTRPGWPLFQIQQALHLGDPIQWMSDSLMGKDTLKVRDGIACGIVVSQPDYPYGTVKKRDNTGYPIFDMTMEDATKNIHLSEVKMGYGPGKDGKNNEPCLVTAGSYVLTVSGVGDTVEAARDTCYKTFKKKVNMINSPMVRDDIGKKLEHMLPELQKNGYCKDIVYS